MLGGDGGASVGNKFFLLLLLFSVFVLGDIVTTTWLIHNDPAGISNEGNPFGAMLYLRYGVAGLFLGKMTFFLPYSIMILTTETKYQSLTWYHKASEIVVLGLIAYSLIVFLNNVTAIIVLNALKGLPYLHQLLAAMKLFILVFSLTLEVSVLGLLGEKSWMRGLGVAVGTLLIVGPLLYVDPLYTLLAERPALLVAYLASTITILGIALYIAEEITQKRGRLREARTSIP